MPVTQRHPLFRPLLTVAIIAAVVIFLAGLFYASISRRQAPQPAQTNQQTSPDQATPEDGTSGEGAELAESTAEPTNDGGDVEPGSIDEPAVAVDDASDTETRQTPAESQPSIQAPATGPPLAALGLRARVQVGATTTPAPIGSLSAQSLKRALVTFTPAGAGVKTITMSGYFESVTDTMAARQNPAQAQNHYRLQREIVVDGQGLISLAARAIVIDGTSVDLISPAGDVLWRETAPGAFDAEIITGGGETGEPERVVVKIERRFHLPDDSYEIVVEQRVINLTDRPMDVQWIQYGPVDLEKDTSGFRIPTRRVRFGYLLDANRDPSRQIVEADDRLVTQQKLVTKMEKAGVTRLPLWPDTEAYKHSAEAVWVSQTSRYFAFAVHPLIDRDKAEKNLADPSLHPIDKPLDLAAEVEILKLGMGTDAHTVLQMHSEPLTIEPGATADLDFGAYAGPMSRRVLSKRSDPVYGILNLRGLVIYQIGWCGWCTFQPIARLLLMILDFFHDYLVGDWALAIVLLVLFVRGALHPIFKKSQVSMMRFSKQMQAVQPKIKKLQEKYKNEPQKLREEQMRLMKEERVNYAGMLGCLPMFMQTPIWIALYASLFFAFELRHEPAFYGVFQWISGGHWLFLADLSRPDNLFSFGKTYHVPGLSAMMGTFSGINILPLMWGFIFYIHQKYLTPPTSATMTPEQEQTQKIVKIMMVVMMPVFMYNAPSGLLVYFVTNSVLAIAEGRYIRSHVDKMDLEPKKDSTHQLGRKKVKNTATPASPFGKKRQRGEQRDRYKKR